MHSVSTIRWFNRTVPSQFILLLRAWPNLGYTNYTYAGRNGGAPLDNAEKFAHWEDIALYDLVEKAEDVLRQTKEAFEWLQSLKK